MYQITKPWKKIKEKAITPKAQITKEISDKLGFFKIFVHQRTLSTE